MIIEFFTWLLSKLKNKKEKNDNLKTMETKK